MRHLLKPFILSLALSFSYAPSIFALPPLEQSKVVNDVPEEIKKAMYQLKTMAEIFAIDSGGVYPSSLEELHQVAIENAYDFRKISVTDSEKPEPQEPIAGDLIFIDGRESLFLIGSQASSPLLGQHYTIVAHPAQHQGQWKSDTDLTKLPTKGAVVYYPVSTTPGGAASGYFLVWLTSDHHYAYQVSDKGASPRLFYYSND